MGKESPYFEFNSAFVGELVEATGSQAEAAKRLGVSESYISKLKHGERFITPGVFGDSIALFEAENFEFKEVLIDCYAYLFPQLLPNITIDRKVTTTETREKLRQTSTGQIKKPTTIKKISASLQGTLHSQTVRDNMSRAKLGRPSPNKGRKFK